MTNRETGHPVRLTQDVLSTGNITRRVGSGLLFIADNLDVLDTHSQAPHYFPRGHSLEIYFSVTKRSIIYPCASCNLLNPALPKMCAELCGKRRLYESRGRHWHPPYLTRLPREYVSHVYLWIPPSSSHKTQTCLSPSTLRPSEILTRSKRWPFSRHHFDGRVNTQCEIGFGSLEVCSHSVDKTGPPRPCDLESVHPSIELYAECRFITA